MKKLFIYVSTLVIVSLLCVSNIKVNAAYNYTPDKDEIASAESLVAMKSIDSSNLVDKNGNLISSEYSFGSLYDVADDEENIYVSVSYTINSDNTNQEVKNYFKF